MQTECGLRQGGTRKFPQDSTDGARCDSTCARPSRATTGYPRLTGSVRIAEIEGWEEMAFVRLLANPRCFLEIGTQFDWIGDARCRDELTDFGHVMGV